MRWAVHKDWSAESSLDTPYKRARQEWDNRIGGAVIQARNWRLATFGSLGLVLASIAGLVYLGAQPKAVPHIVTVDRLGAAQYHGPVGESGRGYRASEASLKYHLRRFVDATRSLSSDPAVVKRNWLDAYTLLTENAATQLSTLAQQNDPFKRLENERVSIDIVAMGQLSGDTWQVDWRESTWDKTGNLTASAVWRGNFRVVVSLPVTEEQLARNPIGLFIDEFHWSRVQTSKGAEQ